MSGEVQGERFCITVLTDAQGRVAEVRAHENIYAARGYAAEIMDHFRRYGAVANVAIMSGEVYVRMLDSGEEVRA